MLNFRLCFVFCVALVALPLSLSSQSFTGAILGSVKDSSGSGVPGAAVAIVNVGTNARTEVRSNDTGDYSAPLLQPGLYRVEASAGGFKKFLLDGITLQVQQQARVDIMLTVGDVSESVSCRPMLRCWKLHRRRLAK